MARVPRTARAARAHKDYTESKIKPGARERHNWVMLKQQGRWSFARAASATPIGRHTVCYYDPKTGFYDDCHETG